MQLRMVPIALSLLATLTLLFGGWFLYQKMEVEEPIKHEIGQMESAKLARLEVAKDRIQVDLTVTNPELFPREYQDLRVKLADLLQNKAVDITIHNNAKALEDIWTNGVFSFTEAVDLHEYSRIPQIVSQWKEAYRLDEASTQMDEENIYVYLKRGTDDFYTIVPRYPAKEVTARG
ncbi:hypothetical protein [Brevibacillus sp. H7]|uniref:hypothetical protein n=1 Tax=Brevibacillus sp. H7 TaxID=3349138 RepID=UPI0037FD82B9